MGNKTDDVRKEVPEVFFQEDEIAKIEAERVKKVTEVKKKQRRAREAIESSCFYLEIKNRIKVLEREFSAEYLSRLGLKIEDGEEISKNTLSDIPSKELIDHRKVHFFYYFKNQNDSDANITNLFIKAKKKLKCHHSFDEIRTPIRNYFCKLSVLSRVLSGDIFNIEYIIDKNKYILLISKKTIQETSEVLEGLEVPEELEELEELKSMKLTVNLCLGETPKKSKMKIKDYNDCYYNHDRRPLLIEGHSEELTYYYYVYQLSDIEYIKHTNNENSETSNKNYDFDCIKYKTQVSVYNDHDTTLAESLFKHCQESLFAGVNVYIKKIFNPHGDIKLDDMNCNVL